VASILKGTIDLCHAAVSHSGDFGGSSGSGAHQVQQFAMICPDGATTENCVPPCTEALNGDELLLNIFGEDTRMTCELHLTLYSWVGAAGDGGFIGHDHVIYISSVLSHASGIFSLIVIESVAVATTRETKSASIEPPEQISAAAHGTDAI
jgi:hypothetical protein